MRSSKAGLVYSQFFADVSQQLMPIFYATYLAFCLLTCLSISRSSLLPTSIISILSTSAFQFSQFIQKFMDSNDYQLVMSQISKTPSTFLQQTGVIVRNRSCPAVSHSCIFTVLLLFKFMTFCLYYMPIVGIWPRLKSLSQYWVKRLLLPTALYPSKSILTFPATLSSLCISVLCLQVFKFVSLQAYIFTLLTFHGWIQFKMHRLYQMH